MTEAEKCQIIANSESFDDLKKAFDKIGKVPGSRKDYSPERLKEKVDFVIALVKTNKFNEFIPFNLITRTYGIRAKMMELLWYQARGI